jgi:colanic acid biosynthesis glycosyl transferase WcaI
MAPMSKPGKLIVVGEHYAPDSSTTATCVAAIAQGLSTDTEVLVISGTAHSASAAPLMTAQPRVMEVGTSMPDKDALVQRAIAIVLFSVKISFATLKHVTRNDVVLCVTTPFTLPYSVTLAVKLRGASATLLIYDLYPEALVMAGPRAANLLGDPNASFRQVPSIPRS